MSAHNQHSTPALRTPMARVWFWIDKFASEESLQGRGNDEYWSIKFRGSDLWNLRQAVESLEEQLEAARELLRETHDLIWNHDAPYVEGGPGALDKLAQQIETYLTSNPASEPESS